MQRLKYFVALLASATGLLFISTVAIAQQPEFGGRASDYHPPTRNPQGSTPAGLQPSSPNPVQPAPTASTNPQALMRSGNLKVLTSPDGGASTTASETAPAPKPNNQRTVWILGGILSFIIVFYLAAKGVKQKYIPAEEPAEQPVVSEPTPKKAKKTTKKKSGKKANPAAAKLSLG